MKRLSILLCVLLLITSCDSKDENKEYSLENTTFKEGITYDKSGNPIKGVLKEYDENGNLLSESIFKNGKQDGVSKSYDENGNLLSESIFKNGKQDGVFKIYYESGKLKTESIFKDGKLEGPLKSYYSDGNLQLEVVFKDSKAISGFYYYEDGEKSPVIGKELDAISTTIDKLM